MKQKKVIFGVGIILAILLFLSFNNVVKLKNKLNSGENSKYVEVLSSDKNTESPYVEFDAYFVQGSDMYRGIRERLSNTVPLTMNLNVSTNGELENAKIEFEGIKNYKPINTLQEDEFIKSISTNQITFNDIQNGANKTIILNLEQNVVNTSGFNAKTELVHNVNKLVFTGTHVDDEGNETEIRKEIPFTIDWYGDMSVTSFYSTSEENKLMVDQTNNRVLGVFRPNIHKGIGALTDLEIPPESVYMTTTIPTLGGVKPTKVHVYNLTVAQSELSSTYDEVTGNLTIKIDNIKDNNGYTAASENYKVTVMVEYPYSAYESRTESNLSLAFDGYAEGSSTNELGNVCKIQSNHLNTTCSVDLNKVEGEVLIFDVMRLRNLVKSTMKLNYSANKEFESTYEVDWRSTVNLSEGIEKVIFKEDYSNIPGALDRGYYEDCDHFRASDGTYYPMGNFVSHTAVQIPTETFVTLGADGYIDIYDGDNAELVLHITAENATQILKYSSPIKNIYIETSAPIISGDISINTFKNINVSEMKKMYSEELFDTFNYIYSSVSGYIKYEGQDEILPVNGHTKSGGYSNGCQLFDTSLNSGLFDRQNINERILTLKFSDYALDRDYAKWVNPTFIVEFPEEFDEVSIKRITISQDDIVIASQELTKEGNKFLLRLKLNGILDSDCSVKIKFEADVGDFIEVSKTKIKTWGYNELCHTLNWGYASTTKEEDIYDINGNGDLTEIIQVQNCEVTYTGINQLVTNTVISNFDDKGSIAGNVATIDINDSTSARINVNVSNGYSEQLTQVKILGRIPFEGNKYIIAGENLNSNFSTTMTSDGIRCDNVGVSYKVYYSTNGEATNEMTAENAWTLTPTNWSEVKSYLIDFEDYVIPSNVVYKFYYDVDIPSTAESGKISYAIHSVNFKINNSGAAIDVEPSKTGLSLVTGVIPYTLILEDYKYNTDEYITYASENEPNVGSIYYYKGGEYGEEYVDSKTVDIMYNGVKGRIEDLYPGVVYTIKQRGFKWQYPGEAYYWSNRANHLYVKKNDEISFKVEKNDLGQYECVLLSGDTKGAPILREVNGNLYLDLALEHKYEYKIVVINKVKGTEELIDGSEFNLASYDDTILWGHGNAQSIDGVCTWGAAFDGKSEFRVTQNVVPSYVEKNDTQYRVVIDRDENGMLYVVDYKNTSTENVNIECDLTSQPFVYLTVENEYKKFGYTVNHIDKDTGTTIQTVEDEAYYNTKLMVNDLKIDIDGYVFDSADVNEMTIGEDASNNVMNIYYTKRTDLEYTVKYLEKDTDIELHAPETKTGMTFESVINAADEVISIDGYNVDSYSADQITITTGTNEITIYYTKRTDLEYTVKYLEKDTDIELHVPETKTGITFESVINAADEVISIDGYNVDSYSADQITILTGANELTIYYTKRTDLTYTVNYLEKDTNNVIATAKTVDGQTYLDSVTENAIDVAGYEKLDPTTVTITIAASNNEINFYYTKRNDLSYTVNYLEQGTNEVLAAAKTVDGQIYQAEVTENAIDIAGYNKAYPTEATITIDVTGNEITFYYTKRNDLSYTVNYLEEGTEEVIATAKTVGGQTYQAEVTENAIDIAGYNKVYPTEATITIDVTGNEITFYYTKRTDLSYTVNYLEKDTNEVLATAKTVDNQTYLASVTENAIDIAGYNKVYPTEATITIDVTGNEINFYYEKRTDLSYTVNYLEKDTNEVLAIAKTVNNQTYLASVTENAIDVAGYNKAYPTESTITIGVTGNEINFYYTKRTDLSYTVNYLEKDTDEVLATAKTVDSQTYKAEVTENAIDIEGYNKLDPTEATITIDVANNEINFYYTKRTDLSYTVNYLEKDTDEVLATAKNVNNQTYLASVTENAIDVAGYNKLDPTEATITIGVTGNEITFYYTKRTDLVYTVNYLEKDSDVVIAEEKVVDGQTYKAEVTENAIEVEGYNKVDPTEATITIDVANNEINFYYTKRTDLNYTVNYLEKDTDEVLATAKIVDNQTYLDSVTENAIDVDGYNKLDPTEATITIGVTGNEITFYYTKRTDLSYTVNYLEKDTNEVIATAKTVNNQTYKSTVTENAIDINGYNKQDPSEATITIDVTGNEITFYYTKRTDLSYTVNYLEKDTDEVIATAKTVNNQTYLTSVTENAIDITGYNKIDPTEATITIDVTGNEINFYYEKRNDLSYTVNYLEEGTGEVIATAKTVNNQTYLASVTENAIDVAGYNKAYPTEATITIGVTDNEITFYYTKRTDLSYTVKYLELDETFADDTDNKVLLAEEVVSDRTFKEKIKPEETGDIKDIYGFTYYTCKPLELEIGVDNTENVIVVYYTRVTGLTYTVNYIDQDSGDEIFPSLTVNEFTDETGTVKQISYEDEINSNDEIIHIPGYDFVSLTPDKLIIDTESDNNIINIYYELKTDYTYVVNYLDQENNEPVFAAKTVGGKRYHETVTEDAIDVPGYNKVDPIQVTITINDDGNDVINFYYTKRMDLSYTVNYLEEGTNEVVATAKTVNGQTYKSEVTENAVDVTGYDKVNPIEKTITIDVSGNEINFYYTKRTDISYTVNYLEEGTNEVIATAKIVDGQTYKASVTENAIDIAGYDKKDPTTATLTIEADNNEINFYYTKRTDLSYTVNYLEEGTNEVIATAKTVNGQTYKAGVTENAIDVAGYDKKDPITKTLTIEADNNEINFYYTKRNDLSYTVNYLEEGTDEVIATAKTVNGQTYKAEVTENAIDIAGYDKKDPTTKILTIEADNNEINFYYTKRTDISYTVNYLEEGTNEVIATAKTVNGQTYKASVTENAIDVDGYDKKDPTTATLTIEADNNEINFYYTKRTDLGYTVNYLEEGTDEVIATAKTVSNQTYKASVTENAINIAGYDKKDPTEKTITIDVTGNEINFYYTKRTDISYTVNYLEEGTNEVIATAKIVDGQTYKASVTENAIDIAGYDKKDPTTATLTIEADNNEINFYYTKRTDLSYTVNYLEKDTNEVLATAKTVNGQTYKASVTENAINIAGYDKQDPATTTITIDVTGNEIHFYYIKRTDISYTVNYLEEGTDEVIATAKTVNGQTYKASVTENAIDVAGYNKVDPTTATLTIEADNNEINFYYTKRTDLNYTVNYLEKDTNEILATAKIVNGQTYKASVTENAIDINGYNKQDPSEAIITIDVDNNEINFYYTKRMDLSYTIKFLEKDDDDDDSNNTVLHEPIVKNGVTFEEVIDMLDEVIDIDGYTYHSGSVDEITISTGTNEITIYYEKRTDLSYKVNYLEYATNNVIHESKTVNNMTFKDIVRASDEVIDIYGYNYFSQDKVELEIATIGNVINIYYVKKDAKVIVHYYEKDSTDKVAEDRIITGKVFDRYTTEEDATIPTKYELINEPTNKNGDMTEDDIEVIYYYQKKLTDVVIHHYLEGSIDQKVAEDVKIVGRVDDAYLAEPSNTVPAKYELAVEPTNKNGYMVEASTEVIYYYRVKDAYAVVKYLDKNNNDVLSEETRIEGKVDDPYSATPKDITNYTLVGDSGNTNGTLTISPIEVKYYYLQNTKVNVLHVDRTTGDVLQDEVIQGKEGDTYTSNSKTFANYVLIEEPINKNGIMTKDEITIIYYYLHVAGGVIEKHVDVISGNVLSNTIHSGNEGDSYNIVAKDFTGYDLYDANLPANATGTMTIDPIEVTYYYIYKSKVTAKYINSATGVKLTEDVVFSGHETDTYITEVKDFEDYRLEETPANATGTMTKTPIEVVYRYAYISQGVKVNYYDVNTGAKIDEELIPGYEGDAYSTTPKVIDGYDLLLERLPANKDGVMGADVIEVNYYYVKNSQVTIKYIDKVTGAVLAQEVITGHQGDTYTSSIKSFEGYDLTKEPGNANGTIPATPIDVVYEYARPAVVKIKYVDSTTNNVLAVEEKIEGYQNDTYSTEAKYIEYYTLLDIPDNANGKMEVSVIQDVGTDVVDNETTVVYYYRPKVFNLQLDKVINRITVNGVPQNVKDDIVKVELDKNKVEDTSVQVEYLITVTNTGELVGKTTVQEVVPNNMKVNQNLNKQWTINDNVVSLQTKNLNPGEAVQYKLILDWVALGENLGTIETTTTLTGMLNEAGFAEGDMTDNINGVKFIITVATGAEETISYRTLIVNLIVSLMATLTGYFTIVKNKKDNE